MGVDQQRRSVRNTTVFTPDPPYGRRRAAVSAAAGRGEHSVSATRLRDLLSSSAVIRVSATPFNSRLLRRGVAASGCSGVRAPHFFVLHDHRISRCCRLEYRLRRACPRQSKLARQPVLLVALDAFGDGTPDGVSGSVSGSCAKLDRPVESIGIREAVRGILRGSVRPRLDEVAAKDRGQRCGRALGAAAALSNSPADSRGTGGQSVAAVLMLEIQLLRGFSDRRAGWRHTVATAVSLVALTTTASAQPAASHAHGPSTAEVALCWGLLGRGVGPMPAAYNWRGGAPDRPTSVPRPDLVSWPNPLVAGAGAVAGSVG